MTRRSVIFDGDFGGDDCLAVTALTGHGKDFHLLGITTVFGNTDRPRATDNALRLLSWLGRDHIPVLEGAGGPIKGPVMFGDNAFGPRGIGKAQLLPSFRKATEGDAVEWMAETLRLSQEKITIFAAGPLTNIAHLLMRHPDVVSKIESVITMGGGLAPGPQPHPPGRKGNITEKAEFNMFQDPFAANIVIRSNVALHLVTMDATQNLTLNFANTARLFSVAGMDTGMTLSHMMRGPVEQLDREKFGADGPFVHDPVIVAYALRPDLFDSAELDLRSTESPHQAHLHGELYTCDRTGADAVAVTGMKDKDAVLGVILDGIARARQTDFAPKLRIAVP